MTAPSWHGPTVTGSCDNCGAFETMKDPEVLRSPEKHESGYCTACERMVTFTVWRGPVMPV